MHPCPIWPEHKVDRKTLSAPSGGIRAASWISCPTCGDFDLTEEAEDRIKKAPEDERWRLSWATRHASEAGEPLALSTADVGDVLKAVAEPRTPVAKADLLLALLASRTRRFGERVAFDNQTDWPLFYACGPAEAVRILVSLKKPRGFIDLTMNPAEGVELTFEGWEHAQSLLPVPSAVTETAATSREAPHWSLSREGVFVAGQQFDAFQHLDALLSSARKSITIVDGYLGVEVLNVLTEKAVGVSVRMLTNEPTPRFLAAAKAFNAQYGGLSIRNCATFHDRFVVVDDSEFYHFGASLKDLGKRGFMFSKIEEPAGVAVFREAIEKAWAAGADLLA